jgi:hypothetical protein
MAVIYGTPPLHTTYTATTGTRRVTATVVSRNGKGSMNTYPRETTEFLPITITQDGEPITTYQVAITKQGTRPAAWAPPTFLNTGPGVLISNLPPGIHTIWARIPGTPETPVLEAGNIHIT